MTDAQPTPPVRKNRAKNRYELTLATLMRHPGKWALIAEGENTANLVRLRNEKRSLGFEFVARDNTKSGHVGKIYARYNPESGMPFIPDIRWEDPPSVRDHKAKIASYMEVRIQTVCDFATKNPKLSTAEIAAHWGITPPTALKYLKLGGVYVDRRRRKAT